MLRKLSFVIASLSIISFAACSPKSEDVNVAGKGGNVAFHIHPVHGTESVDSCKIFIKYNVLDAPADGKYNDSVLCNIVDGKPMAAFTNLRMGNYYLYARGFNPDHNDYVKGGAPVQVTQDNKIYDVTITLGH